MAGVWEASTAKYGVLRVQKSCRCRGRCWKAPVRLHKRGWCPSQPHINNGCQPAIDPTIEKRYYGQNAIKRNGSRRIGLVVFELRALYILCCNRFNVAKWTTTETTVMRISNACNLTQEKGMDLDRDGRWGRGRTRTLSRRGGHILTRERTPMPILGTTQR